MGKKTAPKEIMPKEPAFCGIKSRIVLKDGRSVFGDMLAYDGKGNFVLSNVVEKREYAVDGEKEPKVCWRALPLLAVPKAEMVSIAQCKEPME